jgi:uncharacterized membrane protein HdeD (DUF308 family)
MTDPQSSRPESAGAPGLATERPPAGQPAVPPQASGRADSQSGGPDGAGEAPGTGPGPGSGRAGMAGKSNIGAAIADKTWMAIFAGAVAMIAVGVLLLVWPQATLTIVALLIGAALIVAGLIRLVDGVAARDESGGMRAADIVIGLLAIVAGLYCLKHHSLTVLVLAIVVGVFWVVHGIGDLIVSASSGPVPGRGFRAIGGLFSLAAGLVILFWPGVSLILLLTILGAWLLLYGVVLAGLSIRLRHDARAASGPARVAPA